MAQVYTFTDSNGEVRLAAEINPAPGGQPSVTDGTTTVSASTIRFPTGTVMDAGAGVAEIVVCKIVKSPLITNSTPGLASSGSPGYVDLFSVADGQLAVGDVILDVWVDVLEFFDGPDNAQLRLYALSGGQQYPLYGSPPDLAYSSTEDNSGGNTPGLGSTDNGDSRGLLDVRTNNAVFSTYTRVLPSAVTASDLVIALNLSAGTTWTQGQMYVYALVATPT